MSVPLPRLILLILGLLGEYVWRAVEASRNRPVFIIDEMKQEIKQKDKQ